MNPYYALIKVIETGSFTRAAEALGYTQSAVSQMVHSLETELATKLILRSRTGIKLTPDGEEFLPFIRKLCNSHQELLEKQKEMEGLQSGLIRIGTLSSVSCNWLPGLMKEFKEQYPDVRFGLFQGEYTSIADWIKEGTVNFGFVNPDAVTGLTTVSLQEDEMLAVLPKEHPLTGNDTVLLKDLTAEPYILLDVGKLSEPLSMFRQNGLEPNIQFRVYDDYAIMSMVEQGLGVSILPKLVLKRSAYHIETRPTSPPVTRTISIAYRDKEVLPIASRYFIDFAIRRLSRRAAE
ncbi:LysR family transcriptional regulator [Indiicoccus explosivorum]|uniref:LysR family transcriptional regulator n=1 Tax=Indiicoccus explosivorum TaxID=1917864 RepID=UPI000B4473B9|nr:LysR family transcriptional regulator [Indiicoccus explosivorum]